MRRLVASAALCLVGATPAVAAAEPLRPQHARGQLGDERLSDERTLTRWAYVGRQSPIRSRPTAGGPRVDRLRLLTENGYPEVYLALRSRLTDGRPWIEVRIPGRPNGRTGWVPRDALGPLRATTTALAIDRGRSRAVLRRAGRRIWHAPIGHGAAGAPTPTGHYYVRERIRNLGGSPIYGPWAFGTSAYSSLSDWPGGGVVGIHGTNQPELIPGRPSHGCIRVRNDAIRRLATLLPVGTPILIR
jgi:hypothetical protein